MKDITRRDFLKYLGLGTMALFVKTNCTSSDEEENGGNEIVLSGGRYLCLPPVYGG